MQVCDDINISLILHNFIQMIEIARTQFDIHVRYIVSYFEITWQVSNEHILE